MRPRLSLDEHSDACEKAFLAIARATPWNASQRELQRAYKRAIVRMCEASLRYHDSELIAESSFAKLERWFCGTRYSYARFCLLVTDARDSP